jgi:hypothetical protein
VNVAATQQIVFPVAGLRPEAQLLLCCARKVLDDDARNQVAALLPQDIDWEYFVHLAVRHRVVPLVNRSLGNALLGPVPAVVLDELTRRSAQVAWRNLLLTGKLVELLKLLDTNEIRAIAYKGPVIAAVAYGEINLRQFGDLDVLVHPRDYRRARNLLVSRGGYRLRENWGWECLLIDATDSVHVDLHRYIAADVLPGSLWFDRLWKRRQHVASAGGVQTLSAEDMLVMLTIQLRKDGWEQHTEFRLSKICDIAEMLRIRPSLDWDAVTAAARRLGCQRALVLALGAAQELLGAPVNADIAPRVESSQVQPLIAFVCHRLFADKTAAILPPMSNEEFHFRIRERWRDRLYSWYSRPRVRAMVRNLRPSAKDRLMIALPRRLSFLYYVVRPIRVGRDYARSWFKEQ